MKNFKKLVCSVAIASMFAIAISPINVFADNDAEATSSTSTETTTTTTDTEYGTSTTTTTTTSTTDENGNVTNEVVTETVIDETGVDAISSMPLSISAPSKITKPADGVYTVDLTVHNDYELVGLRMIQGQKTYEDWDAATPCTTTITIPEIESDSWYTVIAKDVKGNIAYTSIYVHCEKEPTPTPTNPPTDTPTPTPTDTPTPAPTVVVTVAPITVTPVPETQGCPDGYTMKEDGNCYAENPGCPEGYQENENGICVQVPTCPEGQYLDENGNCVEKVQSLPQTGGFDSLMMFFVFGIGLTACGVGVVAYADNKEKANKKNNKEE